MFKEHTVVMLPTNEKAPQLGMISTTNKGELKLVDKDLIQVYEGHKVFGDFAPAIPYQHLYFISDEEIKEGDWYYSSQIGFSDGISYYKEGLKLTSWKKIIATTDSSIARVKDTLSIPQRRGLINHYPIEKWILPQPSQSFIKKYVEEYNKGNIISDVMVEYENHALKEYDKPRVNPRGNTITIRKLKTSWTREEVEKLCKAAYRQGAKDEVHGGSWFFGNEWVEKILQL